MEKTVESEDRKSRRDVLKALGAAAAGTAAGSVLSAKEAQASHGTLNASSATGNPAIHGDNTADGEGVVGTSSSGIGVRGNSDAGTAGVRGSGHIGVEGLGNTAGVSGQGNFRGVQGTGTFVGVSGQGDQIGAEGFSLSGIGVFASTTSGIALQVQGQAKFSTAGSGTILVNDDSASVSNVAVTASSHITVTLTGDPGQAGSAPGFKPVVVWVERDPGTGFTIHLSKPVRVNTPFTYLILEPV